MQLRVAHAVYDRSSSNHRAGGPLPSNLVLVSREKAPSRCVTNVGVPAGTSHKSLSPLQNCEKKMHRLAPLVVLAGAYVVVFVSLRWAGLASPGEAAVNALGAPIGIGAFMWLTSRRTRE